MHTQVIAEGSENEQELKTLRALRVPYGQGFFLGRPMPNAHRRDREREEDSGVKPVFQVSGSRFQEVSLPS